MAEKVERYDETYALGLMLGQSEKVAVSDTTKTDAGEGFVFWAIHIVEDAVFSALVDANLTGSVVNWSWASGDYYFGQCTSFTLASGKVEGFKVPVTN